MVFTKSLQRAVAIFLAAVIAGAALEAAARDLTSMSADQIGALQQRLADAKCYTGPRDGKASAALEIAKKSCPDQEPILRIETGMHVGRMARIGIDVQCRIAATASDDKTVRLWSLSDGHLLRTLRGPIGAGNGGKVYATALSPDGRFVAAGGWDAQVESSKIVPLTIFDASRGAIVARVGSFEDVAHHLAFSPDGRWLVATLGGGKGVRMIDAATWREVASDKTYAADSYGAAFGPDGRLYTVGNDGKIRRYGPGPGFAKELEIPTQGGKKPFSIAVDSQGTRVAVGFFDTTVVDLYDAATLTLRGTADTKGAGNGNLFAVAWRGDGQVLIAGGRYDQQGYKPLMLFDRDGRRLPRQPSLLARNSILNIQSCGAGFAVATSDPAFGLFDGAGDIKIWRTGGAADMREKLGEHFAIAADAKRLRFGLGVRGEQPVAFDLVAASRARGSLDRRPAGHELAGQGQSAIRRRPDQAQTK
jgi:WD domain, G-beta repeat